MVGLSVAICSKIGAMRWHGPHQLAVKSAAQGRRQAMRRVRASSHGVSGCVARLLAGLRGAAHGCACGYSSAVRGLQTTLSESFSIVEENAPGDPQMDRLLLRARAKGRAAKREPRAPIADNIATFRCGLRLFDICLCHARATPTHVSASADVSASVFCSLYCRLKLYVLRYTV